MQANLVHNYPTISKIFKDCCTKCLVIFMFVMFLKNAINIYNYKLYRNLVLNLKTNILKKIEAVYSFECLKYMLYVATDICYIILLHTYLFYKKIHFNFWIPIYLHICRIKSLNITVIYKLKLNLKYSTQRGSKCVYIFKSLSTYYEKKICSLILCS